MYNVPFLSAAYNWLFAPNEKLLKVVSIAKSPIWPLTKEIGLLISLTRTKYGRLFKPEGVPKAHARIRRLPELVTARSEIINLDNRIWSPTLSSNWVEVLVTLYGAVVENLNNLPVTSTA